MSTKHAVGALLVGAEPELPGFADELKTPPHAFNRFNLGSNSWHRGRESMGVVPRRDQAGNEDHRAVLMSLDGLVKETFSP
jgi:hypothetical protein